jgi:hypothetical protein
VFTTPTSATGAEAAARRRLRGLKVFSTELDEGGVVRVLGGSTGGSQVATCMPDGRMSHAALWQMQRPFEGT